MSTHRLVSLALIGTDIGTGVQNNTIRYSPVLVGTVLYQLTSLALTIPYWDYLTQTNTSYHILA